ncbi:C2H2 finger domain transcription factor mtfA [Penicillium atrosanguineum]|nr:C2H2 finger domain transcription factor mtfA [Penicillium atrosanguineum]
MDLASLLQGSIPKSYAETYGKRSALLSPPAEELKCLLPSVSALLKGANDHAAKCQRFSPQCDHAVQYDVRMPFTLAQRPGFSSGHASPSSRDHRPSTSSINFSPPMGPGASPAPSMSSSSHTSLVEAQSATATMYYRPPINNHLRPLHHPPARSIVIPHPPPDMSVQLHTNKSSIATSARSAKKLSRVPPRCAFTPTAIQARSPGCGKVFSVRSNRKRHERGCPFSRLVAATALRV